MTKLFASYAHWMTEGRKLLFADIGILLLRLWLGLSMLCLHGIGKWHNLMSDEPRFLAVLGLDMKTSLALAVFSEVICSAALIVGFLSRLALTQLIATMFIAFFVAHGGKLIGEGNGEMAFIYLAGYVALFVTGPGRFSVDALIVNHFKKAA
ncbi:DoxX family protein [Kamptonema cortianum]|nr:DoxX family protein [Oscillatoria laete-virens]MDK3159591.1 DoxX family protein [Kamptonema cortianum]MDL5048638.1 DoxX family protein [Oscillatoria amoena NRMC-F 0135]MDL5053271.1 DoxX family protein [Oscillatoria laete-virens NRMC-F 0139]